MCSVSNCHYWTNGNICDASQIMVTSDQLAAEKPDRFDALQASTAAATPAGRCEQTCCKTFVRRGSDEIQVDGVQRM
jgi:hypothetical protein